MRDRWMRGRARPPRPATPIPAPSKPTPSLGALTPARPAGAYGITLGIAIRPAVLRLAPRRTPAAVVPPRRRMARTARNRGIPASTETPAPAIASADRETPAGLAFLRFD